MHSFDSVSQAYNFYCSKRLRGDPDHSLAPSYRIFFENVDRVTDNKGYRNSEPLHIKTLTITGLPVESLPCVDIFDTNGPVWSSHISYKQTNMCTWNQEYGDGFYKVMICVHSCIYSCKCLCVVVCLCVCVFVFTFICML
jgi:hypothetical protein